MKQATSLILIVTVAVILLLIPTSITASGVEDTHEHRRESQIVEGAESIHTADHFIGDMVESTADAPKTNWPELVGMSGEQAKATIMSENSSVTEIQILPAGSIVTMDYREDRVRIFVDGNGNVSDAQRGWRYQLPKRSTWSAIMNGEATMRNQNNAAAAQHRTIT